MLGKAHVYSQCFWLLLVSRPRRAAGFRWRRRRAPTARGQAPETNDAEQPPARGGEERRT